MTKLDYSLKIQTSSKGLLWCGFSSQVKETLTEEPLIRTERPFIRPSSAVPASSFISAGEHMKQLTEKSLALPSMLGITAVTYGISRKKCLS